MAQVILKESGVVFDEERHTYTLNGLKLSGITGMLHRQLYPEMYKGVSEQVLNAAADYGTGVHKAIEMWDVEWDKDFEHETELEDYISMCKEANLRHEKTEYTVTDGKYWASNIDKVYRTGEDTFSLGDIKTYGEMTQDKKDKARWQLSIYAYLFELQNKKAKVDKLFIIHIRNKKKSDGTFDRIANIVYVNRIPSDICKELLDADVQGAKFKNPFSIPDKYKEAEQHIRELIMQKDAIEKELAEIKASILADMEQAEQKTWSTDTMKFTRKLPSIRAGFDMKHFREDHPDIDYKPYETETKVSGSVTISI